MQLCTGKSCVAIWAIASCITSCNCSSAFIWCYWKLGSLILKCIGTELPNFFFVTFMLSKLQKFVLFFVFLSFAFLVKLKMRFDMTLCNV